MQTNKKKRNGIKIEHNKKLFWTIILLLIAWIILIYFIVQDNKKQEVIGEPQCQIDNDCLPACGCHSDSCIVASEREKCPKVFCSQSCSGPLDCGAGYCGCVNNKCQVVPSK